MVAFSIILMIFAIVSVCLKHKRCPCCSEKKEALNDTVAEAAHKKDDDTHTTSDSKEDVTPSAPVASSPHRGKTSFSCPHCDFTTLESRKLIKHIEQHENEEPDHTCPTCGQTFSRESAFKAHMAAEEEKKSTPARTRVCNF
jgi:Zinc finger, C2H2 type.